MIPKFRGWHKELEQMIYGKEICGHIEYTTNLIDALNTMLNEDDYGIEVMQSTGLKDKNGVDIFEESKVKPNRGEPFIVKHFIKGQGIIKHVEISSSGHLFEGIYSGEELEVIGNIYENPELLGATQ